MPLILTFCLFTFSSRLPQRFQKNTSLLEDRLFLSSSSFSVSEQVFCLPWLDLLILPTRPSSALKISKKETKSSG